MKNNSNSLQLLPTTEEDGLGENVRPSRLSLLLCCCFFSWPRKKTSNLLNKEVSTKELQSVEELADFELTRTHERERSIAPCFMQD